ncbi:MAG: VOC family protein, partial [Deltaproteobacteria bacterium]|nr:VOC family protein [Deltaproteobacteria bacterium]
DGKGMLEIFEFKSPKGQAQHQNRAVSDEGYTHICLSVKDMDSEYKRLKAAGMRFHCPPLDLPSAKVTYGRDPDGNIIEFLELLNPENK